MTNIAYQCLYPHAQALPGKAALLFVDQAGVEQQWTYGELYEAVARLATGLRSLGHAKGTRLVIRSLKNSDFVILYFAALAVGWVPISSLSNLSGEEEQFTLEDSQASFFYQQPDIALAIDVPANCQQLSYEQVMQLRLSTFEPLSDDVTTADDLAFLVYTSGTTSRPKAIMHAHSVLAGREPMRQYWLMLEQKDVVLHTGKPCWTYAMGVGFFDTWLKGATAVVYVGEDDPCIWFALIALYKVTLFAASPSVFRAIENCSTLNPQDVSTLRYATSAGEKCPEALKLKWQQHYGKSIYEALGMSECSTPISSSPIVPPREGSIGKPQPGRLIEVLPIEGGGESVAPGEIGLLALHRNNPGFMLGYLHETEVTRQRYRGDWYLSGDLVSKDRDGYLYYHGRYDDILNISGGHRVAPLEIEQVIRQYNDIGDVIVGLSRENDIDNLLTAYIVPGTQLAGELLADQIVKSCCQHLSGNKVPRRIAFIESMPKNRMGKVDRRAMQQAKQIGPIYRC